MRLHLDSGQSTVPMKNRMFEVRQENEMYCFDQGYLNTILNKYYVLRNRVTSEALVSRPFYYVCEYFQLIVLGFLGLRIEKLSVKACCR